VKLKELQMRLTHNAAALAALAGLSLAGAPAFAQAPASPPAKPAAAPQPPADPVLAKVNGQDIRMSDLNAIAQSLPPEARQLPPQQLVPQLLDQAIQGKALVIEAKKEKLDQEPIVAHAMAFASDRALEQAMVSREVGPTLTEDKIKARFDKDYAGKPGEEEVHARHILVKTEQEAKDIIAQLKAGADFAALAKTKSTDPGASNGGDLGFFKAGDMLPEFSAMAFSLKPGEISPTPVQTRYGWHVIKVEERKTDPAPTFEQLHDQIRQQLIEEGITATLSKAVAQVKVERFNFDGTPIKPEPAAPAAAKPAKP
jgi:peptidyl-prolyl cis-trans isomerase C